MSQAIAMMPQVGGYGEYEGTNTDGVVTATKDTAAEAFLTEGLSKVLKINNICDAAHLADCGIAASFTNLAGSTKSWPKKLSELNSMFTSIYVWESSSFQNPQNNIDTLSVAFETQNGESIVAYYNPYCQVKGNLSVDVYIQPKMCANFIYDLNGNKGPNSFARDIGFITVVYSDEPTVIAPMPLAANAAKSNWSEASRACITIDSNSRLPNNEELMAMFFNREFIGVSFANYWSGTSYSSTRAWRIAVAGDMRKDNKSTSCSVRCIKR